MGLTLFRSLLRSVQITTKLVIINSNWKKHSAIKRLWKANRSKYILTRRYFGIRHVTGFMQLMGLHNRPYLLVLSV